MTHSPGSADGLGAFLESVMSEIREDFDAKHRAREDALAAARRVIQHSANCIRAVHRAEFDKAEALLATAGETARAAQAALAAFPDIYHAGFLHDAIKEYVEATMTLALVRGDSLPTPRELGVEYPAYLNGLAEAASELRRASLDALRHGDVTRPEQLLAAMDEILSLLVTIDYPDAITRGLRRNTDMVRGVTERTRGDLTVAAMQRQLRDDIVALRAELSGSLAARSESPLTPSD